MSTAWVREIELQKVFGMSPAEAHVYALAESGFSDEDIASERRVSPYTIRALKRTGRKKMKAKLGADISVVILKGDKDVEGVAVKLRVINVILKFVSRVTGAPMTEGTYSFMISGLKRSSTVDLEWVRENLMRKVDVYGAYDSEGAERIANRLFEVFAESGAPPDKVGLSLILFYLDQMYMHYDVFDPESCYVPPMSRRIEPPVETRSVKLIKRGLRWQPDLSPNQPSRR